jgi:outer membrane protein TolC
LNLRQASEIFSGVEEKFGVGSISRVDLYDERLAYIGIAEQFIDRMSEFFTALAALEDSCQTPLLFQYKVLASMNNQLKDPLE